MREVITKISSEQEKVLSEFLHRSSTIIFEAFDFNDQPITANDDLDKLNEILDSTEEFHTTRWESPFYIIRHEIYPECSNDLNRLMEGISFICMVYNCNYSLTSEPIENDYDYMFTSGFYTTKEKQLSWVGKNTNIKLAVLETIMSFINSGAK